MGKEKRHLTHFETFAVLSMEGVLPFLFCLAKQITRFLFYWLSLHQFAFYKVLRPYRLKQRELAGVKYSIIWCCLPGCRPMSILAAYARIPCEVQSTCLNEYMLYKCYVTEIHGRPRDFQDTYEIASVYDEHYRQFSHLWVKSRQSRPYIVPLTFSRWRDHRCCEGQNEWNLLYTATIIKFSFLAGSRRAAWLTHCFANLLCFV